MVATSEQILKFIRAKSDRPMKMKELGYAMDVTKREYPKFRNRVKELIQSGKIVKLKGGRIGLASEMNIAVGEIAIVRSGAGFVPVEGEDVDIMIPQSGISTAMDGDKVMVRIGGLMAGRKTGTIIRIVERAVRNIVGIFHVGKNFTYVNPDNPRMHRDIYIPTDSDLSAEPGEKVVCVVTEWDDPYLNPEGKIIERLGFPGDPGVDMLTVIRSFDLPEEFPDEVLNDAEKVAIMPDDDELVDYQDLCSETVYTIDPKDAKDHDDAVSVTRTANGYRLGVFIADVSYFVREGSALDVEALRRGNSVYLPGMVIPMLPESLSNDICSLKPNRRRLSHGIYIDFDKKGKMIKWELVNAIIKSKAKLSYEDVQEYFDGADATPKIKKVEENLNCARELSHILSRKRFSEGSLDFDLPESQIILNNKGEVLELGNKVRLEAHRLVEEFMLVANQAVALEVFRNGQHFLYRVHPKPSMEKLEAFSLLMKKFGQQFPVSPQMKPMQFARFLEKIKELPESDFINELMLRSMQKAVYQRENIGHFGLAFKHYAHFTSPIRRYPDLIVHRLLRKLKHGKYPPAFAKKIGPIIDNIGTHCSERERIAESAERQAIKVKQVSYMARFVGDEFEGVISGVTSFGFFVRLNNLGAEGLVRISTVDDDYYHYDEAQHRMVGRSKGRIFRLGDPVKVIISAVDKVQSEITLVPAFQKKSGSSKKKNEKGEAKGKPKGKKYGKAGGKPKAPKGSGFLRKKTRRKRK